MKKIDLLICVKHMYTMTGEGVGYLADHGVAVDGGKIIAVEAIDVLKSEYTAEKLIESDKKVLLPGFIDGHMHAGHGVLRGVAQDINAWMMEGMAPFEAARPQAAKDAGARLAIAETIMAGTTTIGDDGTGMRGSLEFIEKAGVRGNVSVRVREAEQRSYKAGELYTFDPNYGQQTLNECLELFDEFDGKDSGRIRVRFGPQGPDFLSYDLMVKIKELAKERKSRIHMHLSQGSRETKQMEMRYGSKSIPWLASKGYFDKDFTGIHLTDATDEECKILADAGGRMVLCSSSIGIIDGEIPPAKMFQDHGGICGLGSDQAPGNNCHNMFNEMKLTAILNKCRYHSSTDMPAWKVMRMATIECARALGIDDVTGSIEVGKDADLILVDTHRTYLTPVYTVPMRNLIPNLVYSARGDEVDTVIVQGRLIVEERKPLTFDVDEIIDENQKWADEIGLAAKAQFEEINGANAQYMREGKL